MPYALAGLFAALVVFALYKKGTSAFASPEQARAWVGEGALLVDVRSPAEFAGGHIEGAKNIPVSDVGGRLDAFEPRDQRIVLYCRSGARSGRAKATLEREGFTDVHNLGPMSRWPG